MPQAANVEAILTVLGTRINARRIHRKLATAEKKLREAMAELADAQQAITDGENEPEIKLPEFEKLRSSVRIAASITAVLKHNWEDYEEARSDS